MITVSENFKTAMKQPVKEIQAFISYGENSITDSDDLISYKISCDSGLCKSAMRKLEAKYLGSHSLLGKWVNVGFGVKLPNGAFDVINYGTFLVTELTETKDTETTSIVAYDKMVNAMTPYQRLDVEYPLRLIDYTRLLCEACNLELKNDYFGKNRVPSFDSPLWKLSGGAFINSEGNIELPNLNSEAKVRFDWNKKDEVLNVQFLLVSGGNYHFNVIYYDENGVRLSGNGHASANKEDNFLLTAWFGGGEYGEALKNAKYIEIAFCLSTTYAPQPYSVKNITADNYLDRNVSMYEPYNLMNDWQVTATTDADGNVVDLWENIDGITYRDILVQIAQATGSTCIIHDDKVYFKPLADTGETLTYDNMFKLKLEALYGEINSVVLSRTPAEDNIYLRNETSVQTNGLTEFKIENNEIVDKNRNDAITPIFDALNGISYYPFEATTEGLGWYEIGDNITIINDLGEEFKTSLFNYTVTVDGSIKETLKTTAENKTQTQYQYATSLTKRVKNAEIIVDKQASTITNLVTDMYEENGVVNRNYAEVKQYVDKVVTSIQHSGGNNIIQNSVMFAHDQENNVANWTIEGDGSIVIGSNTESVSQHGFTLLNKKATARVSVLVSTEENPIYYSFSTKIKKDATGNCYVKIYNSNEEHTIPLGAGESAYYNEYALTKLEPKNNYYIIEFYGSADSNATFTDNMLAMGENKIPWTQANGEVMNTNVNIDIDGITVKSVDDEGNETGDYTVISKIEFAGYSYVNGVKTKVFSLNKDVTKVSKLLADNEITMPPIKIVPITEGDLQGWAFVPC